MSFGDGNADGNGHEYRKLIMLLQCTIIIENCGHEDGNYQYHYNYLQQIK
jgi:hypothetical protein